MPDLEKLIERGVEFIWLGALGTFGGIANYVYSSVDGNRRFVWGMFVANVILACFVGVLVGQFIDLENPYRDGYIMAAGFCAYPILQAVQRRIAEYLRSTFPNSPEE